jgi:hypothetical protein
VKLLHRLEATLELPLSERRALLFVQEVEWSLSKMSFMQGLKVTPGEAGRRRIQGIVPVSVPPLGRYELPFTSELEPTPEGVRLHALPLEAERNRAEISGEAVAAPTGSRVRYRLDVAVHLELPQPQPERWGSRAFAKMIALTAEKVIADLTDSFATELEAAAARDSCPEVQAR